MPNALTQADELVVLGEMYVAPPSTLRPSLAHARTHLLVSNSEPQQTATKHISYSLKHSVPTPLCLSQLRAVGLTGLPSHRSARSPCELCAKRSRLALRASTLCCTGFYGGRYVGLPSYRIEPLTAAPWLA